MPLLIWMILEVVVFAKFVESFGWGSTLAGYFLPSILGVFLLVNMGRMGLMSLQGSLARGEMPGSRLLHVGALFVSALLFVVPSFTTRIFALALFLPGLRHLMVWRFKKFAEKKMANGSSTFFQFGKGPLGGFTFYRYDMRTGRSASDVRDVTPEGAPILDVTPIKVTHGETLDSDSAPGRKDS